MDWYLSLFILTSNFDIGNPTLNKIICATIKALLRDSRDSKRVMLVLALREIRYVQ